MKCRHCQSNLTKTFLDLGTSPPSNFYLSHKKMLEAEAWVPLKVMVCTDCWLVQTVDYTSSDELFAEDYAYFSSFSQSWLEHSAAYVDQMIEVYDLDESSTVVEVAANDGYLLQFVANKGIPCFGIEPTKSTASAARAKGIEIVESFFGVELAKKLVADGKRADLLAANNVLAHVPDINDFVSGFSVLLSEGGVATFEFPHFVNLVKYKQFDTVYHEHFSYLSLTAVSSIFERNGLKIIDVEEIPTHGGSLRVHASKATSNRVIDGSVAEMMELETLFGIKTCSLYEGFQWDVDQIKYQLLSYLLEQKALGLTVVGYGAAAKGNTLLNYCGIRSDLVPWVVDKSSSKQNTFLPGSRIPVVDESWIRTHEPDIVLILPWNLKDEIMGQLAYIRDWGGKFCWAIPELFTE